jgi:hypothetical protein
VIVADATFKRPKTIFLEVASTILPIAIPPSLAVYSVPGAKIYSTEATDEKSG